MKERKRERENIHANNKITKVIIISNNKKKKKLK